MSRPNPSPVKRTAPIPSRTVAGKPSPGRSAKAFASNVTFGFPWTKMNVIGIVAGVCIVVIGYLLMSTAISPDVANNDGVWNNSSAVSIGPILLVIGYCVVIPFSIFKRFGASQDESNDAGTAA